MGNKKDLSPEQRKEIIMALKARFEKNMHRHKGLEWDKLQRKLESNSKKLWSLNEMERTGGEPDVVAVQNSGSNLSDSNRIHNEETLTR